MHLSKSTKTCTQICPYVNLPIRKPASKVAHKPGIGTVVQNPKNLRFGIKSGSGHFFGFPGARRLWLAPIPGTGDRADSSNSAACVSKWGLVISKWFWGMGFEKFGWPPRQELQRQAAPWGANAAQGLQHPRHYNCALSRFACPNREPQPGTCARDSDAQNEPARGPACPFLFITPIPCK